MKQTLFSITLVLGCALKGFTQNANESIIRHLDSLEGVAFIQQDYAALDTLWAADMKVNNPRNTITLSAAVTGGLLKKGIIKHFSMERTIEHLFFKENMVVAMGHESVIEAANRPEIKRRSFGKISYPTVYEYLEICSWLMAENSAASNHYKGRIKVLN